MILCNELMCLADAKGLKKMTIEKQCEVKETLTVYTIYLLQIQNI